MKGIIWAIFFNVLFVASSCQTEERVIAAPLDSITGTSALTALLKRVSQHPTAADNVLDGTSCFGIKLPLTVIVNGQPILVSTEAEYSTINYLLNISTVDDDLVSPVFPITVFFKNHNEATIISQQQFESVIDNCGLDSGLSEIRCIDINYPISVDTYDSDFQLASAVTIGNDVQLYNFLDHAGPDYVMEILYPVILTRFNGEVITSNTNLSLQQIIENNNGSCSIPGNR